MKSLKYRINESFNKAVILETSYEDAISEFNDLLRKNSDVKKIADHFGKDVDTIVKKLQVNLKVNRYSDKSVKEISINFTEKDSGVKVSERIKYDAVNESADNFINIDLDNKDVEKAKKALSKDFTIDEIIKQNAQTSGIYLKEKPSKENYAKLKKAMGSIKWEHGLPF